MADRIQSSQAAKMLGVSKRQITLMAARGELPGACKIASLWTFDPEKLTTWIEEREQSCQEKTRIKTSFYEGTHTTFAPTLKGNSSKDRYEQAMLKLRAKPATKCSKKQKIGPGAEIVSLHGLTR